MKAGTMEALDAEPSLTQRRCSIVSIWHESGVTLGELRRVSGAAPAFAAVQVPGTRFSIN